RPLRELRTLHNVRRHRRMATDRPVQIAWSGRVESGRLLDVSAGGARISGATGVVRGDLVELRLPSDDDPALFHELGNAYVAWADDADMGVQFDRLDSFSRTAVIDLVRSVDVPWAGVVGVGHRAR